MSLLYKKMARGDQPSISPRSTGEDGAGLAPRIHYLSDALPEDLDSVLDGLAVSPPDFVLLADFVSDLEESFLEASFPLESLLEDPASASALAALL